MEGRKEGKKKTKQKQRKVGWGVLNAVLNVFIKDLIKFELETSHPYLQSAVTTFACLKDQLIQQESPPISPSPSSPPFHTQASPQK